MDEGWKAELRNKVYWNTVTLVGLKGIMSQVQKKSFPDLKRTINLFRI